MSVEGSSAKTMNASQSAQGFSTGAASQSSLKSMVSMGKVEPSIQVIPTIDPSLGVTSTGGTAWNQYGSYSMGVRSKSESAALLRAANTDASKLSAQLEEDFSRACSSLSESVHKKKIHRTLRRSSPKANRMQMIAVDTSQFQREEYEEEDEEWESVEVEEMKKSLKAHFLSVVESLKLAMEEKERLIQKMEIKIIALEAKIGQASSFGMSLKLQEITGLKSKIEELHLELENQRKVRATLDVELVEIRAVKARDALPDINFQVFEKLDDIIHTDIIYTDESHVQIKKLQEENTHLTEKVAKYSMESTICKTSLAESQLKESSLQSEIDGLQQLYDQFKIDIKQDFQNVYKENATLRSTITIKQQEILHLQEKITHAVERHEAKQKRHTAFLQTLTETYSSLQCIGQNVGSVDAALRTKLNEIAAESGRLEIKLTERNAEVSSLRLQVEHLQNFICSLQVQAAASQGEISFAVDEHRHAMKSILEKGLDQKASEKSVEDVTVEREETIRLFTEVSEHKKKKAELVENTTRLSWELDEAKDQLELLRFAIKENPQIGASYEQTSFNLQDQLRKKEYRIQQQDDEIARLKKEFSLVAQQALLPAAPAISELWTSLHEPSADELSLFQLFCKAQNVKLGNPLSVRSSGALTVEYEFKNNIAGTVEFRGKTFEVNEKASRDLLYDLQYQDATAEEEGKFDEEEGEYDMAP